MSVSSPRRTLSAALLLLSAIAAPRSADAEQFDRGPYSCWSTETPCGSVVTCVDSAACTAYREVDGELFYCESCQNIVDCAEAVDAYCDLQDSSNAQRSNAAAPQTGSPSPANAGAQGADDAEKNLADTGAFAVELDLGVGELRNAAGGLRVGGIAGYGFGDASFIAGALLELRTVAGADITLISTMVGASANFGSGVFRGQLSVGLGAVFTVVPEELRRAGYKPAPIPAVRYAFGPAFQIDPNLRLGPMLVIEQRLDGDSGLLSLGAVISVGRAF